VGVAGVTVVETHTALRVIAGVLKITGIAIMTDRMVVKLI
jgi:hypothetical protein